MAVEESGDQIRFVAVGAGIVPVTRKVPQERLRDLGVKILMDPKSQHSRSDGHVQELDPEVHAFQD